MILIINFQGLGNNARLLPVIYNKYKNFPKISIYFKNHSAYDLYKIYFTNFENFELYLVKSNNLYSKINFLFKIILIRPLKLYVLDHFTWKYFLIWVLSLPKNLVALKSSLNLVKGSYIDMDENQYEQKTWCRLFGYDSNNLDINLKSFELSTFPKNFKNLIFSKKYIVIFPGCDPNSRFDKKWKIENYIELSMSIIKKNNLTVVYCDSIIDEKITILFNQISNSQIVNLIGKTNISELISIINNSELCIGNDTGPIHLANLLKKKVICLYSETYVKKNIPEDDTFYSLVPKDKKHINKINVEDVYNKFLSIYK